MSWDHWLAEITAHDGSSTVSLTYANGNGFTFAAGTAPGHPCYDARIQQPVNVQRALFTPGSTQGASRIGFGELVLLNGDGALDVLNGYGFDGREIRILRSEVANPAYSDFEVALVGTMEQPEFQAEVVRIKLRDNRFQLATPLQGTKYAGSGLGTLEGADDLKGKPKPVCLGSVSNVKPPCVETAKLIYQVSDKEVDSIDAVYDRGIILSSEWSEIASPVTGQFRAVALGATRWLAVGFDSGGDAIAALSVDQGATWTDASAGLLAVLAAGDAAMSVAYSDEDDTFVIGCDQGKVVTTTDCSTYTLRTSPFAGTADVRDVTRANGKFMAVSAREVATSPTGVTWTLTATGIATASFIGAGISWGRGTGTSVWVIVGTGGTQFLLYSFDEGVTWTAATDPIGSGGYFDVGGGEDGGLFIASGAGGGMLTSGDGRTWIKTVELPDPRFVSAQTKGDGWYVFLDDAAYAYWSRDGATWRQVETPQSGDTNYKLNDVAFRDHIFVAVGATQGIFVSSPMGAAYASSADLLDDSLAPEPGRVRPYYSSTGSYFRLGAAPSGEITADVTEGAAASDRTTAQVFETLLARESITPTAGDLTALDTADNAVIGYWTDEETTVAEVADAIAQSIGASWYIDKDGDFRIKQLTLASGTAAIELTANDIIGPPLRLTTSDVGHGLPVYRVIVRWGKNYTKQTSDLAAGVASSRRAYLATDWRESKAEDTAILTKHLLSPELIVETLLQEQADADAEASRLLTLRKTQRERVVVTVPFTSENAAIDLMDVVKLTHDRLGLSGGKLFRLMSIEANATEHRIRWTLWS